MIRAKDAIAAARREIGTPYGSGKGELDCINLIKKVIRTAPGGIAGYTTAGTNALWDSYNSSGKYKHLTWRKEGIEGAKAGMLAFKRDGSDVHHVGIVTEAGTVVHASSSFNKTVETPLNAAEGWDLLAVHIYIEVEDGSAEGQNTDMEAYKAKVFLSDPTSTLNVRNAPDIQARRVGKLHDGDIVKVQANAGNGWLYVEYDGGQSGYVSSSFVEPTSFEPEPEPEPETTTLVGENGDRITLIGRWHFVED